MPIERFYSGFLHAIYILIFAGLTILDLHITANFIEHTGERDIAMFSAYSGLAMAIAVTVYPHIITKFRTNALFSLLATFGCGFCLILQFYSTALSNGIVFIFKEVFTAVIVLHFGTTIQCILKLEKHGARYPFIYAGGRLGTLLASSAILVNSDSYIFQQRLLIAGACFFIASAAILVPKATAVKNDGPQPKAQPTISRTVLLIVVISSLFSMCRWYITYSSTLIFKEHLAGTNEIMTYLATLNQIASIGGYIIQAIFMGPLMRYIGPARIFNFYSVILSMTAIWVLFFPTIQGAGLARIVTTDLRIAMRNPTYQNLLGFLRPLPRARLRAIIQGWVTPAGTLLASTSMALLVGGSLVPLATSSAIALVVSLSYTTLGMITTKQISKAQQL